MSPTPMRKKMPLAALVILLAVAIGGVGALPASAAATGAGASAGAATARVSAVVPAVPIATTAASTVVPVASAAASTPRSRELVEISGTVQGRGGTGKWAWTMTLSGARVWVLGYSRTVTTDALGRYSLSVNLPGMSLYDINEVRASRVNYEIGAVPLSSEVVQTRDFAGGYALLVKGTGLKVTVWRAGKKLKGATVSCFGKSARTGADGRATLSKLRLKPGVKYTATVAKKGLRTATFSFTSRPGNSIGKSVALRK
jgi:hypothetical protein